MPFSLPKVIKLKIEETLREPIIYPSDCERLVLDIRLRLNETIGVTTIKRLFGFADDVQNPRKSTLDLLARYSGYDCYDDMKVALNIEGDSAFEKMPDINVLDLKTGDRVIFEYLPNRKVVTEYICNDKFKVTLSENGSLKTGDIISTACFNLNHPLMITSVVRNGQELGAYTAGKVSGLTRLLLEKN